MRQKLFIEGSHITVVAVFLLTCLNAHAASNADFIEGQRLLDAMEDAKALQYFQKALLATEQTAKTKAQIYLYMAMAQFNLLETTSAEASVKNALQLDREISLPPGISPKMENFFKKIKKSEMSQGAAASVAKAQEGQVSPSDSPQPNKVASDENSLVLPARESNTRDHPLLSKPTRNWPAWIALGATSGLVGGAVIFGIFSRQDYSRADDLSVGSSEARQAKDSADKWGLWSNVMWGAAGAAAITSAVLFYRGRNRGHSPVAVSLIPSAHGANLNLWGTLW